MFNFMMWHCLARDDRATQGTTFFLFLGIDCDVDFVFSACILPLLSAETLSVIIFLAISFWPELGCRSGAMHFENCGEPRFRPHGSSVGDASSSSAFLPAQKVRQFRRSDEFGSLRSLAPRHLAMVETFVRVYWVGARLCHMLRMVFT